MLSRLSASEVLRIALICVLALAASPSPAQESTTINLQVSPNPSPLYQFVTITATVSNTLATGTVYFYVGNQEYTDTLNINSGGIALAGSAILPVGTYNISAVYSGDATHLGSTSNTVVLKVMAPPAITVTSSQNPSTVGQAVTFTATVNGASPTGVVTFTNGLYGGGQKFGTANLDATGTATLSTLTLDAGTNPITANYGGDSNNVPGMSPFFNQVANGQAAPQSGYWWNPAQGGSGFVIEIQGLNMFMAGFLYDTSGRATWVASMGQMPSTTQYSGSLVTYTGGQTLNGAYQPATVSPSLGTISITFTSNNEATLTWPGGTVPIQRFDIVSGGSSAAPGTYTPQTGWWWNPAEGGRGFAIEVQEGQMYLAGYMYDSAGNPTWYLANGPMTDTYNFQGNWQSFGNGQTLTGAYQAPVVVTPNAGNITVQFNSNNAGNATSATLTLPNGRQIPLSRYSYRKPVYPVPTGIWQPAPGAVPTSGNYVYFQGQVSDLIVGPTSYTYTPQIAQIQFTPSGGSFGVIITGNKNWAGTFQAMSDVNPLQAGYYGDLTGSNFDNPQGGSLSWSGTHSCNTLTGWFAVDSITYPANSPTVPTAIDLRFEQHCDDGPSAMNGQIHWDASDTSTSPGPVYPVPTGLWQAPPNSTPPSGGYLYLESDAGDPVGGGMTYLYYGLYSVTAPTPNLISLISTFYDLEGDFVTMNNLPLQVGYYPGVDRYPFNNPALGGLDWTMNGVGCNNVIGWFAIDNVAVTGTTITALDLRFEQHCSTSLDTPALHGQLHLVSPTTGAR